MSISCHLLIYFSSQLSVYVNIMTTRQKPLENKFEDLKVYINEKLLNQDVKLKEVMEEEVKTIERN